MITIEPLTFIPNLPYAEFSMTELRLAGPYLEEIAQRSKGIWAVKHDDTPILVVGVQQQTFVARPRLWFLMCSALTVDRVSWKLRGLKEALCELDYRFRKLETLVQEDWEVGKKFARFCGFSPTDHRVEFFNRKFVVMER